MPQCGAVGSGMTSDLIFLMNSEEEKSFTCSWHHLEPPPMMPQRGAVGSEMILNLIILMNSEGEKPFTAADLFSYINTH